MNEAEVNDLLAQKLHEPPTSKESLRYVLSRYPVRISFSAFCSSATTGNSIRLNSVFDENECVL